jgi:ADP-ribosyl-[dinitrogen reductase] hydrolase
MAQTSHCLNRAKGALLGLAVGDAVGTTLEFTARDSYEPLTDMVGGGPFQLAAGQWTDDTAMALALADSLLANPNLDAADLMARFQAWYQEGVYSCTGTCFDIGITVRTALTKWASSGDPIAGSADPMSAGNGSLMRLAPVAICHWRDCTKVADVAARQSQTTHGAPEAVDACIAYAALMARAIVGESKSQLLLPVHEIYDGSIGRIMAGGWRSKDRSDIQSSGYVAHSLEAALWCIGRTETFREAILLAVNLGNDADTTAAIAGQLAGAIYGVVGIPSEWLTNLAWRDHIEAVAAKLFRACAPEIR